MERSGAWMDSTMTLCHQLCASAKTCETPQPMSMHGRKLPRASTLQLLAGAFGVEPADLVPPAPHPSMGPPDRRLVPAPTGRGLG